MFKLLSFLPDMAFTMTWIEMPDKHTMSPIPLTKFIWSPLTLAAKYRVQTSYKEVQQNYLQLNLKL